MAVSRGRRAEGAIGGDATEGVAAEARDRVDGGAWGLAGQGSDLGIGDGETHVFADGVFCRVGPVGRGRADSLP